MGKKEEIGFFYYVQNERGIATQITTVHKGGESN